jgi:hypothetical protein
MSDQKRDLLDSLLLRAPAVGTMFSTGTVRLKPGSPLRRRPILTQLRRGFNAMARSDMDVNVLVYEPDTVVWMHGMLGVGVDDCFRGRAVRGDFVGYGRDSGAKTELISGGTLMELSSRGKIARQEWFVEQNGWQRVIEAMSLPE